MNNSVSQLSDQVVVFSRKYGCAKQQRDDLIQVGLEIGGSCNCVDLRHPPFLPYCHDSLLQLSSLLQAYSLLSPDLLLRATKDSNIQPACLYCRSDRILPPILGLQSFCGNICVGFPHSHFFIMMRLKSL